MGRFGWFAAVACALVGFYLGRSTGAPTIEFPDPDEGRSAAEMGEEVARTLREPRAFARASRLVRLFETLTTGNIEAAAQAVRQRAGDEDPVDLQLFLSAWTHLDATGAMREVQSWPIRSRREMGIRIVMREWAASGRAVEAGSYFDSLTDADQRNVAAVPLVRGWALSGDKDGALVLARRFWEAEGRRDVVDAVVRGVLYAEGAEGALDLARSVDPATGGTFDQRIAQSAIDLAAREDPKAAAELYARLAGGQIPGWLSGSLPRLAGLLRNEDPQAALEWILPLPEGDERTRALKETMASWSKRDFEAAWTWFEARVGVDARNRADLDATDAALVWGLVRRMARIRPAQASTWAMRIPPGPDRIEMLRRVAYFWSMTDPEATDRWIESSSLPAEDAASVREAAEWGRSSTTEPDAEGDFEAAEEARGTRSGVD